MNPVPKRLAVTLTAAGQRVLRSGHPWLFSRAVQRIKGTAEAGDLAIIFDRKRDNCIGVGLLDPESPIRIKVLHQGGPARIDAEWFSERIAAAAARREPLLQTDTNGYRLLHGENDGLPALVADVYAGVLVLKLYSAIWFAHLPVLLPLLQRRSETETAVLRLSRNVRSEAADYGYAEGQVLYGDLQDPQVVFREHGLRFVANVLRGHKTGFFLDHRANRRRVGELSEGKDVLDVFSYAGGFSVHALAGGAYRVMSLDISGPALEDATRNVALNFEEEIRHETFKADAFTGLQELARRGETFDLVIVDPPSFAKQEKEVPRALAAYRKINGLAVPLVKPGGVLLAASCSARVSSGDFFGVVERVVRRSGRRFKLLDQTFHDIDHPVGFPEGAYLKSVYYRLK